MTSAKGTNDFTKEFLEAHLKSQKLHEEALEYFAASGATHGSRILDPFRPYCVRAKGSRKWDVDGNEYIDYVLGHGALILGHSHPAVVRAVRDQMTKGVHYGENHELEIKWARLIKTMIRMAEKIEFCSSGMEANLLAVRVARAFTGRQKILRFEENFHGWGSESAPAGSAGVVAKEVTIIPMHDLPRLQSELATGQYALVIIEGGGAIMDGQVPWEADFVKTIQLTAKKYGTVFAIDEVVTGFRDAPGGWQSLINVVPDLTTLGKCVSGGLPCGVLVGKSDIMETLSPQSPPHKWIRHSGTWNANPLLCAAGVAACQLYLNGEPQRKARQMADYFRLKGNEVLKAKSISGRLYGRTIVHLYLGPIDFEPSDDTLPPSKDFPKLVNPANAPITRRLTLHLLQRGVANFSQGFFILSAAHSRRDIDQTLNAFSESLDALFREGMLRRG